ncbi:hypothetical protein FKM82_025641 [Ascaphus truei]
MGSISLRSILNHRSCSSLSLCAGVNCPTAHHQVSLRSSDPHSSESPSSVSPQEDTPEVLDERGLDHLSCDREALPDRRGVVVLSLVVPLPPPEVTSSPDTPPSCDGSPSGISSSTTTSAAGSDGSALRSARAWARPSSAVATTGAWGG